MIRAIIFDLDGVLVDATDWHYEALNMALEETSGFRVNRLEHETIFNGRPTKVKLATLRQQGRVADSQIDRIQDLKNRYTRDLISSRCGKDAEMIAMLAELSKTYTMACYSNAIRQSTEEMLRRSGTLEFMEFFMSNQDVPRPKPHPDGYILAIARLGVRPEETVIVEDSPVGATAAHGSGAHVLEVLGPHDVTLQRIQEFLGGLK